MILLGDHDWHITPYAAFLSSHGGESAVTFVL